VLRGAGIKICCERAGAFKGIEPELLKRDFGTVEDVKRAETETYVWAPTNTPLGANRPTQASGLARGAHRF
jgi:hypothetical protein